MKTGSKTLIVQLIIVLALFSMGYAQGTLFNPAINYAVGSTPFGITTADYNNDSRTDIATANASGTMTVLLNEGNGTFSSAVSYSAGGYSTSICSGDIDGDGDIDAIVTNHETSDISIFKNNGDGTFESAVSCSVGAEPWSIFAADFDGDGDLDLATAGEGIGELTILLNTGNGTFAPATNYSAGLNAFSVYGGDFDGDSDVDLVVANLGSNSINIFLNNGSGIFTLTNTYQAGSGVIAVFVADVIGSLAEDILVLNHYDNNVSVFENDGNANFSFAANYATMVLPRSLYVAKIDSDEVKDIIVANETGNYMSFLKGNGDGTFQSRVNYPTHGSGPVSIVASYFDADQKPDVAVANVYSGDVSVFINTGGNMIPGWLSGVVTDSVTSEPLAGIIVTAMGIGAVDTTDGAGGYLLGPIPGNYYAIRFVGSAYSSKIVSDVYIAPNDTTFLDVAMTQQGWLDGVVTDSITHIPISGATVEITENGREDVTDAAGYYFISGLLSGSYTVQFSHPAYDTKTISDVLVNVNDTTHLDIELAHYEPMSLFAPANLYNVGSTPFGIAAADFNGDNYADIATANAGGTITLLLNSGTGAFVPGGQYAAGNYPTAICTGDIDNDGDNDIVVSNHSSNNVTVLKNHGNGTFSSAVPYDVGTGPWSVYAADFNGDNFLDLATADERSNGISVLLNNGNGTFGTRTEYSAGAGPFSVYGGDFDNDGDVDLVEANLGSDDIYVYLNNGAGEFELSNIYPSGDGALAVFVADVIGSSALDIVVANHYANNVSVFENDGSANFSLSNTYTTLVFPRSLFVAQIDNDGVNDIIVADERSSAFSFLKGVGDGTFEDMVNYPTFGTSPVSIVANDFNNDSKLDVAVANVNSDLVSIFINIGESAIPGWVSGAIIDSTTLAPIPGVIVKTSGTVVCDTTDISGNYLIGGISGGRHNFTFEHSDYVTKIIRNISVVSDDTITLDVSLSKNGWISGIVRDSLTQQPLYGVDVTVIGTSKTDVSDSSGYYLVGGLAQGNYALSYARPDYATKFLENITVASGDTVDLNVNLGPTGYILGVVTDTSGVPLEGALVQAIPSSIHTNTNFSGHYMLDDLASGIYDIQFSLNGYITQTIPNVTVVFNETTTVNAELLISPSDVQIWYGNPNREPIVAQIGQYVMVDVYAQTNEDVYVADLHLCLGAEDRYIDSLSSREFGSFYPPISQWDDASFLYQNSSPPNPIGWSSQSFLGFANLGNRHNPYLHCNTPTRILTMVIHIVNDTSIVGDTANCLGIGISYPLGPSSAGDSLGGQGFDLAEFFNPIVFVGGNSTCNYIIGDINGDSTVGGSDVTFAVRYFKGLGIPPHDSCRNDSIEGNHYLYVAGDVNGNCEFRGSDITRLVAYFKGLTSLSYCRFFPPFRINRRP
jgi:hypothetical protein